MKKYRITMAAFLFLFLSSCVTSVHRLATYDKAVEENRLGGTWNYNGMKITVENFLSSALIREHTKSGKSIFKDVEKNDSLLFTRSYIFRYEKNGVKYDMLASCIRLNGQLFLDTYPLNVDSITTNSSFSGFQGSSGGDWNPTHSFAKVIFTNNKSLELQFLGGEFLVNQLKNGHAAIRHETDDLFDSMVITASSADLQQFLIKYGNDKRLYDGNNPITLEKQ